MFEINIAVRDSQGKDTGARKLFKSDNGYDIWEFYNRNSSSAGYKKKTKSELKIRGQNPEQILKMINQDYAREVIRRKRKTFDDGER